MGRLCRTLLNGCGYLIYILLAEIIAYLRLKHGIGGVMLDIKGKLQSIERERKQKYINIIDFFDFLKRHNEKASFFEIAQFLYIQLETYDPFRYDGIWCNSSSIWFDEHGIKLYQVPKSISQSIVENDKVSFFYILQEMIDAIPFNDESSREYIDEQYHDLYLDRERMQELLIIELGDVSTLNNDDKERVDKDTFLISCELSKTEEFIKNTDINKSPMGAAERISYQNLLNEKNGEIVRLQAEIAELKAMQAQVPQVVESVESYNNRERRTHLQIIGGLVEQLAKTGSKFRKGDNPNYSAIAETIADVTADYENAAKAETIRKRLTEAYNTFTTEN